MNVTDHDSRAAVHDGIAGANHASQELIVVYIFESNNFPVIHDHIQEGLTQEKIDKHEPEGRGLVDF